MEAFQGRLSSFKKSKRVKNPTKSSSTTTLKWPHPPEFRANPETLAEAGFYYDPSYEDPDNVTCYMCDKELGGWEEDDDPFLIHWEKCGQSCCWASVRCGLMIDVDRTGRFVSSDKTRLPSHKSMEKARLETFSAGKGWIHDKTRDHGASSVMMARAGFVFTPQHSGDDLATCFYCSLSLSGWEPEDDPLKEHQKREKNPVLRCPSLNKPASRAQSAKPPPKAQKPSSRSTSRSNHQDLVVPTKTFDGELDGDDAEPSMKPSQSTAKTPRKGRSTSSSSTKKSTAKTPKARSSSRSGLKNVVEEVEDEEDDEDIPVQPQPSTKKKSRSRSKSVAKHEVAEHVDPQDEEEPRRPLRSRSKKAMPEVGEEVPQKALRARSKASIAPSGDEAREPITIKHSRTKSKGKAVDYEQEEAPQTTAKPKVKRAVSRSKSKAPIHVSEVDSEPEPQPEIITVTSKKASGKPKPPQTPAASTLFDDDVFVDNAQATKFSSTVELPPLFIPKRNATKHADSLAENIETNAPDEKGRRPSRSKTKSTSSTPDATARILTNSSVAKEKSSSKSKTTSHGREASGKQKLKVVEVSSDEEPEENTAQTIPKQDKKRSRNSKAQAYLPQSESPISPQTEPENTLSEIARPSQPPIPSPPIPPVNDLDVNVEPDLDIEMEDAHPVTPPRQTAQALPSNKQPQHTSTPPAAEQSNPTEPLFVPALSKIPFTPLHALTDAELDMTVEEWIRYQMEVEHDKFRRDGERELQMFRKRAEEVRKIIEGL
ncbi:hypothetical protein CPB84DRAFT_1846308 [Gymnopilus junonius]|uniref:BIR-domain-containing protein n=1 Tax=Gymnopilus junonius TaxID=109634 RepID=A0A9P5NPY0_GYMJU|nr:hypothetical protein CPB84DRAFT_1846308 [Gymnopilus junonius]